MTEEAASWSGLRFGAFELDLAAGELRKNGLKVRLQEQPFQLLAALVEKRGEVVTREDLKDKLWPGDTYVDFDRSLNTAASKLREALGDSASSPRFVETLPRRGYRFLASIEPVGALSFSEAAGAKPGSLGNVTEEWESQSRLRWAWSAAALSSIAAIGAMAMLFIPAETEAPASPVRKLTLDLPGWSHSGGVVVATAISPNARHIVYESADNRKLAIWDLAQGHQRVLEGTDRAFRPFWSPDSGVIGFWGEEGVLKRVAVDGGPVTRICDLRGVMVGGTWHPDGNSIVFGNEEGKLFEVDAEGGDPRLILSPRESEGAGLLGSTARGPHFLPVEAGQSLVFVSPTPSGEKLILLDLETESYELLANEEEVRKPSYSTSGHIVYEGALNGIWALPFSLATRQITGEPFLIAENGTQPSVAADQTLIFRDRSGGGLRLVSINRSGAKTGEIGQPQSLIRYPSLSPDQSRVAATSSGRIWIHAVDRPNRSLLPFEGRLTSRPIWSSSGREILFTSSQGLYVQPADGAETASLIYDAGGFEFASDWSRDGAYVFYDLNGADIWYLERSTDGSLEPKPFLTSKFTEKAAQISPDNLWLAYVSDETGIREIYLRRFPERDGKEKISQNGGRGVRWSRDGQKLYYVNEQALFEVDVKLGTTAEVGTPRMVFEWPGIADAADVSAYARYDVFADGERFVALELLPDSEPKIRFIENWFEEFRDREQE